MSDDIAAWYRGIAIDTEDAVPYVRALRLCTDDRHLERFSDIFSEDTPLNLHSTQARWQLLDDLLELVRGRGTVSSEDQLHLKHVGECFRKLLRGMYATIMHSRQDFVEAMTHDQLKTINLNLEAMILVLLTARDRAYIIDSQLSRDINRCIMDLDIDLRSSVCRVLDLNSDRFLPSQTERQDADSFMLDFVTADVGPLDLENIVPAMKLFLLRAFKRPQTMRMYRGIMSKKAENTVVISDLRGLLDAVEGCDSFGLYTQSDLVYSIDPFESGPSDHEDTRVNKLFRAEELTALRDFIVDKCALVDCKALLWKLAMPFIKRELSTKRYNYFVKALISCGQEVCDGVPDEFLVEAAVVDTDVAVIREPHKTRPQAGGAQEEEEEIRKEVKKEVKAWILWKFHDLVLSETQFHEIQQMIQKQKSRCPSIVAYRLFKLKTLQELQDNVTRVVFDRIKSRDISALKAQRLHNDEHHIFQVSTYIRVHGRLRKYFSLDDQERTWLIFYLLKDFELEAVRAVSHSVDKCASYISKIDDLQRRFTYEAGKVPNEPDLEDLNQVASACRDCVAHVDAMFWTLAKLWPQSIEYQGHYDAYRAVLQGLSMAVHSQFPKKKKTSALMMFLPNYMSIDSRNTCEIPQMRGGASANQKVSDGIGDEYSQPAYSENANRASYGAPSASMIAYTPSNENVIQQNQYFLRRMLRKLFVALRQVQSTLQVNKLNQVGKSGWKRGFNEFWEVVDAKLKEFEDRLREHINSYFSSVVDMNKALSQQRFLTDQHKIGLYNNEYLDTDGLIPTTKATVILYVIKALRFGVQCVAIYVSKRVNHETYVKRVYSEDDDPPSLINMLYLALCIDVTVQLLLVLLCVFVCYSLGAESGSMSVVIDESFLCDLMWDIIISTVVMLLSGAIVSNIMYAKKYFNYKENGLRTINAYAEILMGLAFVNMFVPYSAFVIRFSNLVMS